MINSILIIELHLFVSTSSLASKLSILTHWTVVLLFFLHSCRTHCSHNFIKFSRINRPFNPSKQLLFEWSSSSTSRFTLFLNPLIFLCPKLYQYSLCMFKSDGENMDLSNQITTTHICMLTFQDSYASSPTSCEIQYFLFSCHLKKPYILLGKIEKQKF